MADGLRLPRGGWAGSVTALFSGACLALGQAPYNLTEVAFVALVVCVALFDPDATARQNARTGWLIGLANFTVALLWIVEPFWVEAEIYGWMAPFALLGLAGGLALFWSGAYFLAGKLRSRWGLVICLAAAELARGYVLTGFPWALISYIFAERPIIQWVSVIGPFGLTLAVLAFANWAAVALFRRRFPFAALVGLGLAWVGGLWITPAESDLRNRPVVRLIQPNAPQHEKWDPDKIPIFFQRQIDFTGAAGNPALILWPETALPMLLHNADRAFDLIAEAASGAPVILGIQRADGTRYHNSLVVLSPSGRAEQIYDKHHLVPFGEYMPLAGLFARLDILGLAARADGGYAAGPGADLLDLGPLGTGLPLICYEAVFPQNIHAAPARADMLIHLTNDAWFGQHSGPYQHLAQARIRAIEQGLPILRAANTGVSAVIDGAGRVLDQLALGTTGFVDVPIPTPLPPTLYSRTGDLPILILLIALAGGAIRGACGKSR